MPETVEELQRVIGSTFVSFMLSFMLVKAWLPFAPKRTGQVLLEVPLGLLQRLLVHRTQAILVLLYILAGSLPIFEERWFLPGTQPAALAALAVILMLPLRYVFRDTGVGLNNGVPRLYKSFRRFVARQGKGRLAGNTTIVLEGRRQGQRARPGPGATLYIPASATAEVTRVLKRHLR
jgi:hypothetical protein